MGRNNQQRRAAKARARAKSGGRPRPAAGGAFVREPAHSVFGSAPLTAAEQSARWITEALDLLDLGRDQEAEAAYRALTVLAGPPSGRRVVTDQLARLTTGEVEEAWRRGWRPAELQTTIRRHVGAAAAELVADAMSSLLARHADRTVDPRWRDELAAMGAAPRSGQEGGTFVAARLRVADAQDVIRATIGGAHLTSRLPPITVLGPLPGHWVPPAEGTAAAAAVEERILERVRALLAKAESTTFDAEADTFTAGAQALMARHSIDAAMLAAAAPGRAVGEGPTARRISIDPPYEGPKVALLDAVATANRCRTVWSKELGFVTFFGFGTDLSAVETIFTSLLVQSTRAMARAGTRTYAGGQSRTRSFRTSFLSAFAHRIGERLREVTEEETSAREGAAGGESGRALVLVLEERTAEVDDAVTQAFPDLVSKPLSHASDAEGWHAGTRAADAASILEGRELRV